MQDEKLQDPGIPASTPTLKKLDNFWYHYKWHTLAALFVLAVLVIGIGLVIGAFAFASYAVFHDCYISLNEKAIRTKIILLVLGVINLILGLISLYHQDLVENGRLTTRILPLLTGSLLLAIILEILIKERLDKRECLDEES